MADDLNVRRGDTFFSSDDEGDDKPAKARRYVMEYVNDRVGRDESYGTDLLDYSDVYVVMFSYVLGSWKALVSTTIPDGRYYEVTYNSVKDETYVDEYKKQSNYRIITEI